MADINTYALGLELQLQTKQAFESLSQLEMRLSEIEKKASSIAPTALSSKEMQQYGTVVGATNSEIAILDNTLRQLQEHVNATQAAYHSAAQGTGVFIDKQQELHEVLDKSSKEQNKILRAFDRMDIKNKSLSDQDKQKVEEINKIIDGMSDWRDATNDAIKVQEKQIKKTTEHLAILDNFGIIGKAAKAVLGSLNAETILLESSIAFLVKSFVDLSHMMDAYVTVSFRALGTQSDLIAATNELRTSLGASAKEGIETFTALSHAGFQASDSLNELAKSNYMFTQATGVAIDVTATYQRNLDALGYTWNESRDSLAKFSAAMRASGLSAQEAGQIMGRLNDIMITTNLFFGKTNAKAVSEQLMGFAAAAKAAGGNAQSMMNQFQPMLEDPLQATVAFGKLGLRFDEMGDISQEMNKYMTTAADKIDSLRKRGALLNSVTLKAIGIDKQYAGSLVLMEQAAAKAGMTLTQYIASKQKNADLDRDFAESQESFTRALKRVAEPLMAIGITILETIGPALVAFLKPMASIATAIAKVVEFLGKIPVVGNLVKAALGTLLVMPIVKKLGGVVDVVSSIGKAGTVVSKVLRGTAGTLQRFGSIGAQAGTVLSTIARGLGVGAVGLRKFGKAVEEEGGGLMGLAKGALPMIGEFAAAQPEIAAVVVAVGAALLIVPKLFEMFDSGNEQLQAFAAILLVLEAPLVVLYAQLRMLWEVVKALWEVMAPLVTEALKPFTDWLKTFTDSTGKPLGLMKAFNMAMEKFGHFVKDAFKTLIPVAKVLFYVLNPILYILKLIFGTGNPLKLLFMGIGETAKFISSAVKLLTNATEGMLKTAKDAGKWIDDHDWLLGLMNPTAYLVKKGTDLAFRDKKADTAREAVKATVKVGDQIQRAVAPAQEHRVARAHAQAVKHLFTPQNRRAEPVAPKPRPIVGNMTESDKKILGAHTKLHEAVTKMHSTIEDNTSGNEQYNKLLKLLEQYLPRIAEDKSKGLSGMGNNW